MTLRDDLVPVVDQARAILEGLGLRVHPVVVRRRTWSGGAPGRGTVTDAELTLEPRPRVSTALPRWASRPAGWTEDHDLVVDRLSLTYTRAQLEEAEPGEELRWLVGEEEYVLAGPIQERLLSWEVALRRVRGR